jgi:protein TonB
VAVIRANGRRVWPRLAWFLGGSLLLHALLVQLGDDREPPAARREEPLAIYLFTPSAPPTEPALSRPAVPRRTLAPVRPPAPAADRATEPAPAAEPSPAEQALVDSPDEVGAGETDHGEEVVLARQMESLVKELREQRPPGPGQPSMTRASPRKEVNRNLQPQYPATAREQGWEGVVKLRVWVSEEGHVDKVVVAESSGYAILDERAAYAVSYWRFVPARRGEVPVADIVDISVPFRLKR